MNKRQAAEALGLSTRAVERAVERGKLSVRYERGKRGHMAVFDPAEVRRYKKEVDVPPRAQRSYSFVSAVGSQPGEERPAFVIGHATPLRERPADAEDDARPDVPISERLTLSVPEAAALAGLPELFLSQAIRDKTLEAFTCNGAWRVK